MGHRGTRVAVVIVSHNSADELDTALKSVAAQDPAEVVVVDNASHDDSVALGEHLGAKVVALGENVGYGAAVNAGVDATTAPYVLAMNPDCELAPEALEALARAFEVAPWVGALGPRVLNSDGSVQRSCRRFPSVTTAALHGFLGLFWSDNPFTVRYQMADWDHAGARVVDWVSGAAVAVRRRAFEEVGGFDPAYFMYVEDVDLCWRLWQAGWSVAYEPSAAVMHGIGTSSTAQPYRLLMAHHRSMLRFERRRRGPHDPLWPLIWLGAWTRAVLTLTGRLFRRRPAAAPGRPVPDGSNVLGDDRGSVASR